MNLLRAPPDFDAAAFADQDLLERMASKPVDVMVEIDRELVERKGLRAFIELGWPVIEREGTYRGNWHIDAIAEHLMAVGRGEISRLAILQPPRTMKSTSAAVMWPAYDWIDTPHRRWLFSSYAHNLSIRDGNRTRRVIQSRWYQERWGNRFKITSDQNTKVRFDNDKNGYRLATSVGGQLTGEGGDIVVIDDPLNAEDANSETERENVLRWWSESMQSRLNDPKTGAFVLIQQRLHTRDVIGYVLAKERGYTILCLPMEYDPEHPYRWFRDPRKEAGELLWPEHVDREAVDKLKGELGEYAASAQLQQLPAPREGGLFKRSWFKIEKEAPKDLVNLSRAWDFAATEKALIKPDPDWTATALIGFSPSTKKYYVTDIARWRVTPDRVKALVKGAADAGAPGTKYTVPKDPGQAGVDQASEYVTFLAGYDVQAAPQTGDKVQRAMPFSSQVAGGNVVLIEGPFTEDFLVEITSFPNGSHDDMVDAVATAFNRMVDGTSGIIEYYRQLLAAQQAAREAAKANVDQVNGSAVATTQGTDLAIALFGKKPG